MTKILRICIVMLLAVLLLPVELSAQSRRDKEQTYVLDQPYEQEDKECHLDDW